MSARTSIAVELDAISITLSGRKVLDRVSLSVAPGELVALLGPNGAGKSTAIKAALGLVHPTEGKVTLGGDPITGLSPRERGRRASYLPQHRQTVWRVRVRDLAALGRFAYGGAPYERLSPRDREAVDTALDRADAAHLADRPVDSLSGGERARAHLARALAAQAPVLLADEPAAALDLRHQHEAMAVLRAEADGGRAVLAALHDIDAALRWADRAVVLDAGRVFTAGPPAETLGADTLQTVFGVRRRAEGGYEPA